MRSQSFMITFIFITKIRDIQIRIKKQKVNVFIELRNILKNEHMIHVHIRLSVYILNIFMNNKDKEYSLERILKC